MRTAFGLLVAMPAVLMLPTAQAEQDPLLRYFPTEKDVPGLQAMGEGRHASGEDLTLIYNGGYKRYLDAGVLQASQRFYRLSGGTVEITLDQLRTSAAAGAFFSSLCHDIKAAPAALPRAKKAQQCLASREGSTYGYLNAGNLLAMVSFDRSDEKAVTALLESVAARFAKGTKAGSGVRER
jgi:hypothetical protein